MIKWRGSLKSFTCSIASLLIVLLAIGSGIGATRSTPEQLYGPQISYLAKGADDPKQLQITTYMTPRASQKINSRKYNMAQTKLPAGLACSKSSQCDSGCCAKISDVIFICGPAGQHPCVPG